MNTPSAVPTFAVVGAVNHGKSSVVATLSENDEVRISSMPGETVENQTFKLADLFRFHDTPGFQNARDALAELKKAAEAREPMQVFKQFIEKHKGGLDYDAECRLLEPVVNGAGIIYVVDGSEEMRDLHVAEMEILRLTGAPRLAIINRVGPEDHVIEWKRRLDQHFNVVREFNAHSATFADRIELLQALAGIERSWRSKLETAIELMEREWRSRIQECSEIVLGLVQDCLSHSESGLSPDTELARQQLVSDLKRKFEQVITEREQKAHQGLIHTFRHRLVEAESSSAQLFDAGLFSADTWQMFGLDEKQLVFASTIAGAAAGGVIDLAVGGHSFMLGTVLGGAGGATGAMVLGKMRPEFEVKIPWEIPWAGKMASSKMKVSGRAIKVGPYPAVNFPWIIIDRTLGIILHMANRAHARRDRSQIRSADMKRAMAECGISTDHWPRTDRAACERIFGKMRKGKANEEDRRALRNTLEQHIAEVARARTKIA